MPVTILVGVQWGDEGKGKIIDVLTENADMVVRFQGGNNAGHTVETGDKKYVLHLIPSGILRKGRACVIGNGLVVDPIALQAEMHELQEKDIDVSAVMLSTRSQLIMPYHRMMDSLRESTGTGEKKIGTTKRGIGPSYADKAYRTGIRGIDLLNLAVFETKFNEECQHYNKLFALFGAPQIDIAKEWENVKKSALYLQPYICDTVYKVNQAIRAGQNILLEGAQGGLLDIDHGTYPFVTSSNTTSGGACTGAGISPRSIDCVYGVMKTYTTRVGEGPFPTELHDASGEFLRQKGHEFGATTGRPRRCGWFDAVSSAYSCMVSGVEKLALTKLDVMDELAEIKICTAYKVNGKLTNEMPADPVDLAKVEPVYESMPGWQCSTANARKMSDLPDNTRKYLDRICKLVNAEPGIISVGPKREQTFKV